jgi:hypothetical protein
MRVRIICHEDVTNWILGKFALKMNECLLNMGHQSDIAKQPDPTADINHNILYLSFNGEKCSTDTFMITHVDNLDKLHRLKKKIVNAEMGICMSRESMDNLANLGIQRNKLSYINPAHDGIIVSRSNVIGLTCRVQEDGRKREHFLSKLAGDIDPHFFSFKIMGDGWDDQVNKLRGNGFQVEYTNHFDYNKYVDLIPSLDYYLYMGQDEGQMGFIDALAAGVETIVTPQGYHLDAKGGITHSFDTYSELLDIFRLLSERRVRLIKSVKDWTWENYTRKHVEIWQYLLSENKEAFIPSNNKFCDGIFSIEQFDKNNKPLSGNNKLLKLKWFFNYFWHKYRIMRKILVHDGYGKLYKEVIKRLNRKT